MKQIYCYLIFIFFGIILFILLNNNETLNIGESCTGETFDCDQNGGTCLPNKCTCESDMENNLLFIKGSIPGSKNSIILIQKNAKKINRMTTIEKVKKFTLETSKQDKKETSKKDTSKKETVKKETVTKEPSKQKEIKKEVPKKS